MKELPSSRKIIAIITASISVVIGLLYLLLIFFLDARGPMLPPPPEALGEVVVVAFDDFPLTAQLPFEEIF